MKTLLFYVGLEYSRTGIQNQDSIPRGLVMLAPDAR